MFNKIAMGAISLTLILLPSICLADNSKPPNILFIMVDDLRPELGIYDHPVVKTPHIDKFSKNATIFTNAYVNVPVCGASRASMMTGVRPNQVRFRTYQARADKEAPDAETLFGMLKSNDYVTHSIGKIMHFSDDSSDDWSVPPWKPKVEHGMGHRNYLLDENISFFKKNRTGPPFEKAEVNDNAYFDGKTTVEALNRLGVLSKKQDPFFLAVGFVKPHLPFNAPKKYWDLYDHSKIHLPDNAEQPTKAPPKAKHAFGELRKFDGIPENPLPVPDDIARQLIHGYYACVSYIDAQIGMLLSRLDSLNLTENTIVFILGDHGWSLGEHGLWAKHSPFDLATRTPLIVRTPDHLNGTSKSGKSHGLVEFVDIFPTITELTKLKKLDQLDGESFAAQLKNPSSQGKSAVFPRWAIAEIIKTDQYSYTEWRDKRGGVLERMLYDHNLDPEETYNVSGEPEYAEIVKSLHQRLSEHVSEFGI